MAWISSIALRESAALTSVGDAYPSSRTQRATSWNVLRTGGWAAGGASASSDFHIATLPSWRIRLPRSPPTSIRVIEPPPYIPPGRSLWNVVVPTSVAIAPFVNVTIESAVSSDSIWWVRVPQRATTLSTGPMYHSITSSEWIAWSSITPPPSTAQVPRVPV